MGINLQDFSCYLCIICGAWCIFNIVASVLIYSSYRNRQIFFNELQNHFEKVREEHDKICQQCRKEHERNLGILKKKIKRI